MAGSRMRCRVTDCYRLGPRVKMGTFCEVHLVGHYRGRGIGVDDICRWTGLTEDRVYALEAEALL